MPVISSDWALEFAPNLGGSVISCAYRGQQILRNATATTDARQTSAFPMLPFIGRINDGRFTFNGQKITLAPNMPPEPHAIHGRGWQSSWQMHQSEDGRAVLTQTYDGNADWPWAYTARQEFSAHGNTIQIGLTLTNRSNTPMPAGLGWHPYFPKAEATLTADILAAWTDEDGAIIGSKPVALTERTDLTHTRQACDLDLDHCFTAGHGATIITWPSRSLRLKMEASQTLRFLTVYTPPGEDFFCVEPVSHIPDSVNNPLPADQTGLQTLQPDEILSGEITLTVDQTPA